MPVQTLPYIAPFHRSRLATRLLADWQPARLLHQVDMLADRVFASVRAPTLGYVARLDADSLTAWMAAQLSNAARQWGQADTLTSEQLFTTARAMLVSYPHLTLCEVLLYFVRLLSGRYGKVAYGRITPDALLAHIPAFLQERNAALTRIEQHRAAARARQRDPQAVTYAQYLDLKARAAQGDAEAQRRLEGAV